MKIEDNCIHKFEWFDRKSVYCIKCKKLSEDNTVIPFLLQEGVQVERKRIQQILIDVAKQSKMYDVPAYFMKVKKEISKEAGKND